MSEHIIELRDHLYFLQGEQAGRFPYCNGLLIKGERRFLVDSGFGSILREEVMRDGDIDVIINTHFHFDHTYGNKYFPKAELWAHPIDALAISSKEVFSLFTGFDKLGETPSKEAFPGGMQPRPVSRKLNDGEMLDFGYFQMQVLHTPGHTPGHISLFEPESGILFAGDIDLSSFGPWYGNIQSNIDDFEASIQRIIKQNPRILVTSHREVITENIQDRLREYAEKIGQREERILQYVEQGKTMSELLDAKLIFRQHPEPEGLYRFFEQIMLEKHIQRLFRNGQISIKAQHRLEVCL